MSIQQHNSGHHGLKQKSSGRLEHFNSKKWSFTSRRLDQRAILVIPEVFKQNIWIFLMKLVAKFFRFHYWTSDFCMKISMDTALDYDLVDVRHFLLNITDCDT